MLILWLVSCSIAIVGLLVALSGSADDGFAEALEAAGRLDRMR